MAQILPYVREASFDADTTRIMDEAFDILRQSMHDNGQPELVLEIIAKRIIEIAQSGERDPAQIANRALTAIGVRLAG